MVDRARFPSDTPSTHGVQPSGVKILDQLGVLEPLLRSPRRSSVGRCECDDVRIEVGGLSQLVGAPMMNARRVTLDALLLDAAAAAGC